LFFVILGSDRKDDGVSVGSTSSESRQCGPRVLHAIEIHYDRFILLTTELREVASFSPGNINRNSKLSRNVAKQGREDYILCHHQRPHICSVNHYRFLLKLFLTCFLLLSELLLLPSARKHSWVTRASAVTANARSPRMEPFPS